MHQNLNKILEIILGVCLAIFPVLILSSNKSGYPVLILLLFSLVFLSFRKFVIKLDKSELSLLLVFTLYFCIAAISVLIYEGSIRDLDTPSRFLLVIPIYFLFKNILINHRWLIYGIIFASLFIGVYEIIRMFVYPLEALDNSGISTLYASILGIVSLFLISDKNHKTLNYFLFMGALSGILASVFLGGRGVWIAGFFSMIVLIKLNLFDWSLKRIIASLIFVMLIFAGGFFTEKNFSINLNSHESHLTSKIMETFSAIDYFKNEAQDSNSTKKVNDAVHSSVGERLEMWKASLFIFKENYLFGVGEGNFNKHLTKLVESGLINPRVLRYSHPHNEYFSSMVEQGIIGLTSLILVFSIPLIIVFKNIKKSCSHNEKNLQILIITIVCHFSFYSLTSGVFDHQNTTLFYAFMIVVCISLLKKISKNQ